MSVKGLLYIIIGLLILFFCPVILIGAGLVLVGGVFLIGLGAVAVGGLVSLMVKAAADPALARKCGLGALIAYAVIAVIRCVPGAITALAARGGLAAIAVSDVVVTVAGYFAACMLLIYVRSMFQYSGRNGAASAASSIGFIFAVIGAAIDVGATCMALYSGMYLSGGALWFLFTLCSCILPLIGFLLLLAQKPAGVKQNRGPGWMEVTPEEQRGVRLFVLGVIIDLALRIVQAVLYAGVPIGLLSRLVGYAGYIPVVLAIVGLVMLLSAKPLRAGAAAK